MNAEEKKFIEWLRKQPKDRKFDAHSDQHCPLGEYYGEMGRVFDALSGIQWQMRFVLWFDDVDSPDHSGAMVRSLKGVDHWIDKEIAREIGLFLP